MALITAALYPAQPTVNNRSPTFFQTKTIGNFLFNMKSCLKYPKVSQKHPNELGIYLNEFDWSWGTTMSHRWLCTSNWAVGRNSKRLSLMFLIQSELNEITEDIKSSFGRITAQNLEQLRSIIGHCWSTIQFVDKNSEEKPQISISAVWFWSLPARF